MWFIRAEDIIWSLNNWYGFVEEISLDHDLGAEVNGTGYDVMLWLEEQVFKDPTYKIPTKISFHSSNPVGVEKMEACLMSIKRIQNGRNISRS